MTTDNLMIIMLIGILLFFVFRGLALWYWKIDRIVNLLESINLELKNEGSSFSWKK